MQLKRITKAFLLVSAVMITLLGITACGEDHAHSFSEWETVTEPTCSANGLKRRDCACGYVDLSTIEALAHTPVIDPAVAATCTTHGKTEGSHCSVCGTVIKAQTETDKLAHNFSESDTVAEATCTSHGLEKHVCDCGYVEYKATDKAAHTPVTDPAVAATCTSHGMTEGSHCSVCGTVLKARTETDKLAHSFSEWNTVVEATCTSHGLEKHVCDCGCVEYKATDKAAHTPVIDPAVAATCTTHGKTEGSHCSVCSDVIVSQEIILPGGHNCTNTLIIKEATCAEDGKKRVSCSNDGCDYSYEEIYSLEEMSAADIYADASKYTGYLTLFDRYGMILNELMGVVISPDGTIVTSNLAFDGAFSATFRLGDVYYDVTEVLAYSARNNLAILKIDAADLPYAKICDKTHEAGSTVYTFGDSEGLGATISSGIISNPSCFINGAIYVNHDAFMNAGFVGGPLINRFGEVIAVNIGYYGEANISISVAEINTLNFDTPMTVAEYGALTYSETEQIKDWIHGNYNGKDSHSIYYAVRGSDFEYRLSYDLEGGYCYVDYTVTPNATEKLYFRIVLDNRDGYYEYVAQYENSSGRNTTYGFIDAATFDETTVLTYDSFYGKYWPADALMQVYSLAARETLDWFSFCLDLYFEDLTLESFGFESITFEYDENALAKLNAFVAAVGSYNSETGAFEFAMTGNLSAGFAVFHIAYVPASANTPASTVVTIEVLTKNDTIYSISIALDPTENGYRFDASYIEFDGAGFSVKNVAWGYVEPDTFTDLSTLEAYVFNGLEDYEDLFLENYSYFTCELLGWTNMLMEQVGISISDIGFRFILG